MEKILKRRVAKAFDADPMHPERKRKYVDARTAFARQARDKGLTLQEIGKCLNKHHSTIVFLLKNFNNLMDTDDEFARKYSMLDATLKRKVKQDTLDRICHNILSLENQIKSLKLQLNTYISSESDETYSINKAAIEVH